MSMQEIGERAHKLAKQNGFWDDDVDANFVLAKLALIHSEASEVLEAYRKSKGEAAIAEECADIFIRLIDLYVGLQEHQIISPGLDFDMAVAMKMNINGSRPRKHGNLI
jgi:NTP pyrophosphatase (non-canonical NTP hydrolase)